MSFLDNLTQMASQHFGGEDAGAAGHVMAMINSPEIGGVSGLVQKFHENGLGEMANSWVANGDNQAAAAEHIEEVLGQDRVAEVAARMGMSPDDAKAKLAQLLPQVVNHMTPNGQVPQA
jgi:uncharacterized protein YidB (DUF937 family)